MRIRSAVTAAGALVAVAAAPAVAGTHSAAGPAAVRSSLRSELNRYLSTRRVPEHISAVSLAVTFRGQRPGINVAVGTNRYDGGGAVSTGALWQICSNTKAFTAVLMLQLEAEHRLSINDTLGKWLPQYRAWRHVTIKRLLNMTSGIPQYLTPAFNRAYAATPAPVFSPARIVSYAVGLPPTTGYYYSDTNYILAQMIIERASHDSYGDQLRKRIIVPLGLRNTFYSGTVYPRAVLARLPSGYFFDRSMPEIASLMGTEQSHRNLSAAQGAGAIIGSLQDLAKWARALYTGRELPPRQQRELQSVVSMHTGRPIARTSPADPEGYGLGVVQLTTADLGGTAWYYEGSGYAFRVLHLYIPRSGTVIALGLNSATDADNGIRLLSSVYQVLHRAGLA